MTIIPLPFAVFGACVGFDTRRIFDVNTAYVIAGRRLPPAVRNHLTGILSGVVPSGNGHARSWKFAFKDTRVTKGGSQRIVVVHEKYSSENETARADFIDGVDVIEPSGNCRITEIPTPPKNLPRGTDYRLELVAGIGKKPIWIVHTSLDNARAVAA